MAVAVQQEPLHEPDEDALASVREILRERWENSDEVNAATVVEELREQHGSDIRFLTAFFDEHIAAIVDGILEDFAKSSRQAFVRVGGGYVKREKLEENARTRLAHVFEANGKGTYRSFLALHKRDLLALNERDQKVVDTRAKWIAFRSGLARKMDAKRTVGDVFSTNEIEAAWRKVFGQSGSAPTPPASSQSE